MRQWVSDTLRAAQRPQLSLEQRGREVTSREVAFPYLQGLCSADTRCLCLFVTLGHPAAPKPPSLPLLTYCSCAEKDTVKNLVFVVNLVERVKKKKFPGYKKTLSLKTLIFLSHHYNCLYHRPVDPAFPTGLPSSSLTDHSLSRCHLPSSHETQCDANRKPLWP